MRVVCVSESNRRDGTRRERVELAARYRKKLLAAKKALAGDSCVREWYRRLEIVSPTHIDRYIPSTIVA